MMRTSKPFSGARASRALMLAVEGLRRGESQPGKDDLDLLRDLAHDGQLLWGRANALRSAEASAAEPAQTPARRGRHEASANVISLAVLRRGVDGDGDPINPPPRGGNAS